MEKSLEKLFSTVLMHWLRCSQLAESEDAEPDFIYACKFTAGVLEGCLQLSGFDTDMKDYVSELSLK